MLFRHNKDLLEEHALSTQSNNNNPEPSSRPADANNFYSNFIAELTAKTRVMLNGIIGFSELLINENLDDTQKEYANEIHSTGLKLSSMIESTLELSNLKSGLLQIDKRKFSLEWFLHEIYTISHSNAHKKGLDFVIKLENSLPSEIVTDITKLRECLERLIDNAIRYTADGMVVLRVSMHEQSNNVIQFDLIDSGIGIPQGMQIDIFRPFKQMIDPDLDTYSQSGLGLSIAIETALLLGGKITVASQPGEGSIFSLQIPVDIYNDTSKSLSHVNFKHHEHAVKHNSDTVSYKHSGSVPYPDDDNVSRSIVTLLLESMGVKTAVAKNGAAALDMVKNEHFNLIILDIEMPVMNGYEAASKLRESGCTIPIVALTAQLTSEEIQKRIQSNFDDIILKPVDKKKLQEIMIKYLPAVKN